MKGLVMINRDGIAVGRGLNGVSEIRMTGRLVIPRSVSADDSQHRLVKVSIINITGICETYGTDRGAAQIAVIYALT